MYLYLPSSDKQGAAGSKDAFSAQASNAAAAAGGLSADQNGEDPSRNYSLLGTSFMFYIRFVSHDTEAVATQCEVT